jgi:small-conductance mechanosensitive channel
LENIITNHAESLSLSAEKKIREASKKYMIFYQYLTPIVYTKVMDSGVKLTLRYICDPRKRRTSENDIWEEILVKFEEHPDIEFAYPTTRFYKNKEGKTLTGENHPSKPAKCRQCKKLELRVLLRKLVIPGAFIERAER